MRKTSYTFTGFALIGVIFLIVACVCAGALFLGSLFVICAGALGLNVPLFPVGFIAGFGIAMILGALSRS